MASKIKIVTDSTSDLPKEIAQEYDITVVPLYVKFGSEIYRDGIDMAPDEFYTRLEKSPILPTTTQPSPGDFINVYEKLLEEGNDIVSIHLSKKFSGTYDTAMIAKKNMEESGYTNIDVIDSQTAAMGLGLIDIVAAKAAQARARLKEVKEKIYDVIPRTHVIAYLDTLEYLQKGGRIGKAQAWLGSLLNIKPMLTIKDGEAYPLERVRSFTKGIERLYEISKSFLVEEISVFYSTTLNEAKELAERIRQYCGKIPYLTRLGPVIGTHTGPGCIGIALIEKK